MDLARDALAECSEATSTVAAATATAAAETSPTGASSAVTASAAAREGVAVAVWVCRCIIESTPNRSGMPRHLRSVEGIC